ncbi:MAG: phenylalanine--tRNA ligase subunit alpha [Nanoarchaeota archaeon]|nr:phenylalanine--tRNA ligase subunit alpha [Nanoarchaeota archaeon]
MKIERIIDSLNPNERKIIPYLSEKNISEICKKTSLDKVSVLRALEYLQNKKILNLSTKKKKIIEIGVNGALYRKKGLPERRLLNLLSNKRILNLGEAQKQTRLSNDEFKASIGALKKKALIEIKNGKIFLNANKEEIAKKSLEELFIDSLPLEQESLTPEKLYSLKILQKRRGIIEIKEKKIIEIKLTELGEKITSLDIKEQDLIEQITPAILKKEQLWKGKKFRRYDVISSLPGIYGGKRHFVNQSMDYARRIWMDLGFKEMAGDFVQSSFWVFDALFTPQDHPVREMQDTFFIDKKSVLPDKKIVKAVKQSHEKGVGNSKGWNYSWDDEEAKKLVLRTHTTCLSAQTLAKLKQENLPAKFFAIGKNFRNETVDWSHGFEFHQSEGIVIDKDANFRHLLGYLKQFFKKMGFDKIRFRPGYFAYTEPSVEVDVWHKEKKVWLELGGAGMFRPEVTIPLLGKHIPVLAWGMGPDRIITDYYEIKDLRELYKNDLTKLRKMKFWIK